MHPLLLSFLKLFEKNDMLKTPLLLLLLPILATSQVPNLVRNPGFETLLPEAPVEPCSYIQNGNLFNKSVANWTTNRYMTPDLVIWQPDNFGDCHFTKPHTGEHAVGIITYHPGMDTGRFTDFHEMVQGELKVPLVYGKKYRIEFYVSQDNAAALFHLQNLYGEKRDIRPTAAGNLGVLFLYNPGDFTAKDAKPQFLVKEPIVTAQGEWKLISGSFTADREHLFFMIGNFSKDEITPTSLENPSKIDSFNLASKYNADKIKRVAYYLIDDFRIVPEEMANPAPDIATSLKTKKSYTFQNVNFETGKWDLLPPALPELDALAVFLKENPKMKVEIGGHTDDVGNDTANQSLSENRASSVANYLISKGIEKTRINHKGYGEIQPVAPNTTAEGRLQNRRVECRIL